MSNEETVQTGRPWDVVAKYTSFQEADKKRNDLLEKDDKNNVKVRKLSDLNTKPFVVKSRIKEEFIVKKEQTKKKKSTKKKSSQ
mgnify:CR=1 FL=1